MKISTALKALSFAAVIAAAGMLTTTTLTSAQATNVRPDFNIYDNASGHGDEADFIRVRNPGTNQRFTNSVSNACTNGQEVSIQAYIHNGASQDYNGANYDGPAVARGSRLALTKSGATGIQGVISADNASSIADTASITCNGQPVDFEFVPGSAIQTNSQGNIALNNNIFTANGTLIGFEGADGILPACWEYVTIVYAKVVVSIPEEEPTPAVCNAIAVLALTDRRIRVSDVDFTANDATINSIALDFGDGNNRTVAADKSDFPVEHQYASAGTYTVTATLNTTVNGVSQTITGNCSAPVEVTEEAQPAYACDAFQIITRNRTITVRFTPIAVNGAQFTNASISYMADGSEKKLVTVTTLDANGQVVNSYTFDENARNITAKATVRFTVNGEVQEVTCEGKSVLGTSTCPIPGKQHLPKGHKDCELPRTGAGENLAGLMAALIGAGAIAHRKMMLKRQ